MEIKQSEDEKKIAYLFTKPLQANKFEFLRQKIGICSSKNQGGVGRVLDIVFFVTAYKCT